MVAMGAFYLFILGDLVFLIYWSDLIIVTDENIGKGTYKLIVYIYNLCNIWG